MSISKKSMALRVASLYIERIVLAAKIDTFLEKKKDLSDEEKKQIKKLSEGLIDVAKSKYIDYLVKNYKENDIVELINSFARKVKTLEKRDLNQYSIDKLRKTLESAKPTKTEVKRSGTEKLYEDDDVLLLKILTKEASCFYGRDTTWCISAQEDNMFDEYNEEGHIYFLFNKTVPKKDPLSKIGIVARKNGIESRDALNKEISENEVPFYNKIKKYLKPLTDAERAKRYEEQERKRLEEIREQARKRLERIRTELKDGVYSGNLSILQSMTANGVMQIPKIKKVTGGFECNNLGLISLKGAPKEVNGEFNCHGNKLISLEGGPEKVDGDYRCGMNELVSFKGSPPIVGGSFSCGGNNIKSLGGIPKNIGGSFYSNRIPFTEEDIRKVCDIKGDVVLNRRIPTRRRRS